jgi:hypothetical protein
MPALIDAAELRTRFDIDKNIVDTRLTPHIGSASRRLRRWVGDTVYTSADADTADDLKNAEAHLAYHYAIFGLNSPLSIKGIVATSMAAEGKEIRKYLSPKETAELANHFLELAREIAEPYLISDGTPGPSFEIASDGDD